jgi:hypothetical protein
MKQRYLYLGVGILVLAAALAVPVFGQPRGPAQGPAWGPGGMPGGWMHGGWFGPASAARPVATMQDAAARVREVLAGYGGDLVVAEVMEFSNHFYVLVKERSTGRGAMELIVERNGVVHPEPGPNMMWNTKYGHMPAGYGYGMMGGGMMGGGWYGRRPATPQGQPITLERARQLAAQYLAQTFPGAVPEHGTAFYGYFTFDIARGGKPVGMLSVNAYTGQVWYHAWHGAFIAEQEFEEGSR